MTSPTSRVVAGREITFPVPVVSASVSGAAFLTRAAVVRRLIAGGPQSALLDAGGAEPVALPGGRTPAIMIHVRYHDVPGNVLGAYHEMGLAFQLKVPGHGTLVHIHELPVDQDFTLAAGNELWGFPKWKADMVGTAGGALDDARLGAVGSTGTGGVDLKLDTRIGVPVPGSQSLAMNCVQVLDGQPVVVTAEATASGGRMRPLSGARVTIAPGADEGDADVARFAGAVRELGLHRARALATFSYGKFVAEFRAPAPIG
ncbi:acetoacetate decarboxylase family protein [Dietzia sp. B32]|uniref:acetoacetate decarboxylase family protein n=1 Tax=Dietzia sp. B32 TaxID=2915130 RepID=UPI0021ADC033|nr:acetoacetate decarboxylase family protein [Dietzia sp. B32]UVE93733.1 acetoacetate decarboxylase family protein [Dietzia sp. B32]